MMKQEMQISVVCVNTLPPNILTMIKQLVLLLYGQTNRLEFKQYISN